VERRAEQHQVLEDEAPALVARGEQAGVVARNESVVRKVPVARRPPSTPSFGRHGSRSSATAPPTSTTPMSAEAARTLNSA
jgi:hypothetical protein